MLSLNYAILHIVTQPTAPTRESWVIKECMRLCRHFGISYWVDEAANMWVNASGPHDLKNVKIVLVTHVDHPGIALDSFHKEKDTMIGVGRWLGGGPKHLKGAAVHVFSDSKYRVTVGGIIVDDQLVGDDRRVKVELLGLTPSDDTDNVLKSFGPWGAHLTYPEVPSGIADAGENWITKSADDLIGVAAMISAFKDIKDKKMVGLLSTSEEIGLRGASAEAKRHLVDPSKVSIISVDFTRAVDDLARGKGPIVRYRDKHTKFDDKVIHLIEEAASQLPSSFQKQHHSKGTTDSTAFKRHNFKVGGIAVVVDNYHNESLSGKPAPEIVSMRDVEALVQLLFSIQHLIQ